ncbi:MAG: alpha/beta hydrolase [Nitratireductor sp.]|nr:alpha/beta hydrolase [Nitratireductor sp.]
MTDYSQLLGPEITAFMARVDACYPADAVERSIAEQRDVYNAMCKVFHAGHPEGVTATDDALEMADGHSIPIRRYTPPEASGSALVIYYHGGGFVVGGLESHDDVCAEICAATGYPVISVDYRLAPEHVHPAHSDDAIAAFRSLAEDHDGPMIVCGDSAGGTLSAAVCHALRGEARAPAGQVLIYPALGGDETRGSYVTHADAPGLTTADMKAYHALRSGGRAIAGDPAFKPLTDTDFSGLPPTVMVSAECDPLNDDCRDYRDALRAAGGKAHWIEGKGLIHGFLRARHTAQPARRAFDAITGAVATLGRGEWPY